MDAQENLVGDSKEIPIESHEITLSFQKLCKTITVASTQKKKHCFGKKSKTLLPSDEKEILINANGIVRPGEIMAIMGPSGSGKTTLLNTLAHRNMEGVTGSVFINSKIMTKGYKRKIGYVLQTDVFFTNLTLREQLTFTAFLRLPGDKASKLARVEEVIKNLGLEKCVDTKILLLSGGEKKRLNIGTELLTRPVLMYLDEPTTGLDSTSAVSLLKTLQSLARQENQKKTIITSIHQPSSQVFESFEKIMLLMNGHTVYEGVPKDAVGYFTELGYKCPAQYNIADYLLDLVNDKELQSTFVEAFSPPTESEMKIESTGEMIDLRKKFQTSWCDQFQVHLQRSGKNAWSTLLTKMNCYKCIGLAISISLCFWRMPFTERHVFDRTSLLFLTLMFWPMDSLFMGLMAWPAEKAIILRERASGTYRLSTYFWAKAVASMPAIMLLPTVFIVISYWACGMNPSFSMFLALLGTVLLASIAAESVGMFISAIVADFKQALTVTMLFMVTVLLLGGFFIKTLPSWVIWVKYLSILYFPYQVGVQLEFNNRILICDGSARVKLCQGRDTLRGDDVARSLGAEISIGTSLICMVLLGFIFRLCAYLAFRYLKVNQGRK